MLVPMIVISPLAGRGLRHVVLDGGDRALCGVNVDGWYGEFRGFDAETIGCKRCKRSWDLRKVDEHG